MALQEEMEKSGNWLFRYRSYIPIGVLILATIQYIYNEYNPDSFLLEDTPYEKYYEMLALCVGLLGLGIRIYTVGHTPKNTSGRNTTEGQVAEALNTTGIYSVVRHPLYLGNFLMWLSPALLTGSLWFIIAFCLFYWVYYERIMYAEEQFLRRKFGQQYLDWSAHIPPFLPRWKNFVPSDMLFSWKKVLKKEKNGLLALFLIFCFFDIIGKRIEGKTDYNYFLIIMTIISLFAYIVLKYLKKYTQILTEENR